MSELNTPGRIRVALLGAGARGAEAYGAYMLRRPDLAQVVAIADPREDRLAMVGERHGLGPEHLHASWEPLLSNETALDAIVIATPDNLHLAPALAAIDRGVAVLLEKPICPTEREVRRLLEAASRKGADVTVAHVLRYTAFFVRIKELLDREVIGRLQCVRHTERIGYWHFAHSYVRGNWRRSDRAASMILSKACHDFDVLRWLIDAPCVAISSFGRLRHFTADNAPEGSTDRCDQGCKVERSCPYSAQRIYLEKLPPADRWPHTVLSLDTSPEGIAAALHEGPYGRCVYRCDNDVADHQVVAMEFANGVDATLTVSAFTTEPTRTIRLMGSHGEIAGDFDANEITVSDFRIGDRRTSQLTLHGEGLHGGGDDGIMADFLGRVQERRRRGNAPEAPTSLEASVASHLMAFASERARKTGRCIRLDAGPAADEADRGAA
jgi:predicted dehydrogenase